MLIWTIFSVFEGSRCTAKKHRFYAVIARCIWPLIKLYVFSLNRHSNPLKNIGFRTPLDLERSNLLVWEVRIYPRKKRKKRKDNLFKFFLRLKKRGWLHKFFFSKLVYSLITWGIIHRACTHVWRDLNDFNLECTDSRVDYTIYTTHRAVLSRNSAYCCRPNIDRFAWKIAQLGGGGGAAAHSM